jgi:hypothetical protein
VTAVSRHWLPGGASASEKMATETKGQFEWADLEILIFPCLLLWHMVSFGSHFLIFKGTVKA